MRIFMFFIAVTLMTGGALVVRASAESTQADTPQVQQERDLPDAAKPKRKLYA